MCVRELSVKGSGSPMQRLLTVLITAALEDKNHTYIFPFTPDMQISAFVHLP